MANTIVKRVGGKTKIADWIKSNLPPHTIFCEGLAGSFAVGRSLPRASGTKYRKVLNDSDGSLINFFKVLRDKPEELINAIALTPYSRADFERAHQFIAHDKNFDDVSDVEWARQFLIYNRQSIFGKETETWCIAREGENISYTWSNLPFSLKKVAEELRYTFIENLDYRELVKKWDDEKTTFYFDPPYLDVEKDFYAVNKEDGFDHEELAQVALSLSGSFVISYYDSDQIRSLYPGCRFETKEVTKHMQTSKKDKEIELLIIRESDWAKRKRERYGIEF